MDIDWELCLAEHNNIEDMWTAFKGHLLEGIEQHMPKISKFYDWRKPSWKCPLPKTPVALSDNTHITPIWANTWHPYGRPIWCPYDFAPDSPYGGYVTWPYVFSLWLPYAYHLFYYAPAPVGWGHYALMAVVCPSVPCPTLWGRRRSCWLSRALPGVGHIVRWIPRPNSLFFCCLTCDYDSIFSPTVQW